MSNRTLDPLARCIGANVHRDHSRRATQDGLGQARIAGHVTAPWQPIPGELWNVTGAWMIALYAIAALGWLMIPLCSFLADHFELFGLRQVVEYAFGWKQSEAEFKQRALYKKVRHPMMLGFLVAFWATPHMTAGNQLFAVTMTAYILVGIISRSAIWHRSTARPIATIRHACRSWCRCRPLREPPFGQIRPQPRICSPCNELPMEVSWLNGVCLWPRQFHRWQF
jgi:hypothetical protein